MRLIRMIAEYFHHQLLLMRLRNNGFAWKRVERLIAVEYTKKNADAYYVLGIETNKAFLVLRPILVQKSQTTNNNNLGQGATGHLLRTGFYSMCKVPLAPAPGL